MKNIDLDDLYCPVPRSNYSNNQIETLALQIEATGGLLRPLIVECVTAEFLEETFDYFEIHDGHLFYYAAKHAEENNLLLNRVPCWVIADSTDLDPVLAQLECLNTIACDVTDL